MTEDELLKDVQRRMDGAVEVLRKEFGGLRTGRASTSQLDPVMVNAYGGMVPLNQVASVNVPEPRMISVQVWDRSVVKAVDKAIREAGLGLNPQTEGQVIRVPIPELNEERRRELTRVAAKYAESARVSVRNVRRDGIEALRRLEKDSEISQDEGRKLPHDAGHRSGAEAVRRTLVAANELGIPYLTLFGFSSENWKRPLDEVDDLMGLLRHYLRGEIADLHRNSVRLRVIGEIGRLSPDIVTLIDNAEALTRDNGGINLTIALSYGGRAEIAAAVRAIAAGVKAGQM